MVSLYTSVPVEDALAVVRDKLLLEAAPSPLQTRDVVTLLSTVFKLTYFTFEGRIYRQKAGLPIWMRCFRHRSHPLPGEDREKGSHTIRPLSSFSALR